MQICFAANSILLMYKSDCLLFIYFCMFVYLFVNSFLYSLFVLSGLDMQWRLVQETSVELENISTR